MLQSNASKVIRYRRKPLAHRLKDYWQIYVLLLPAVVHIFLFNYLPMYGLQIAFRNFKPKLGFWNSAWVGLKWFQKFFSYPHCWRIIKNTLVISLYSLATFPLSILAALLINELRSVKFKKTVQMITYAPHFISTVVICAMLNLFLNQSTGLFNNIIAMLGGERVDFLGNAGAFPHIYVWSDVWQGLGWGTIIYLATLAGVSPELHEAAYIDGANRMQIIWHINIPSILPTVVIMLIMRCGSILSVGFEKVYLLQNPLNLDASQIISTYTYELGLLGGQYSYSTAIGLFNTLVNVTLLVIVNTISRRLSDTSLW